MRVWGKTMKKLILFFILILIFVGGWWTLSFYKEKQRPNTLKCENCNVLIVAFDAEQARHVHYFGYPKLTTPVQDSIAKEGFVFTNNIVQASWTIPSFMSYFTSLYSSEHGLTNKFIKYSKDEKIISNFKNISPEIKTLAEVFKDNGYATAGFTGDAGVGKQFGYDKGFDIYLDSSQPFGGFEDSVPPALEWLKKNKDKKFYMFLHSYGVHGQNDIEEGFTGMFLDFDYKGPLRGGKEEQGKLREEGLAKGKLDLTEEDYKFWRALYDEKIYYEDKKFGQFWEEFKNLGLDKNTILVILSDHGTEFGEHGRFDHGFSLYDELLHVPLIIKFPSNIRGVIKEQVRAIDLMPTLIESAGLKIDEKTKEQTRGKSLIPLMIGQEKIGRNAFSETDYRNYTHQKSLRTVDGWKFIYTFEKDEAELYNLNKDPAETKNLILEEPQKAYELEQELFEYIKTTKQDLTKLKEVGCLPVYGEICTEKVKN